MERKPTAPSVDTANLLGWTAQIVDKAKECKALHDERAKAEADLAAAEKELHKFFDGLGELVANLATGKAGAALRAYADEAGEVDAANQRAAAEYEQSSTPNLEAPAPAAELPAKKIVKAFTADAVPALQELCRIPAILAKVDECRAKIAALNATSAEGAEGFARLVKDITPLLDAEGTWRALAEFVRVNGAEWDAYMEKTTAAFEARKAKAK